MSREIASPVNEDWRSAFIGALGIHLAVILLSVFAPNLFERHRPMPPVYTVKLFETADLPSPKQAPSVKKKAMVPKEVKKKAPLPVKARPKPKKVVSIRAQKPKAKPKKPKPVIKNKDEILTKRLKSLENRVKEKKADDFLKQRLSAVESKIKAKAEKTTAVAAGSRSGSKQPNEVLRLYCIEVWAKVRSHWILPEQLLDKDGLVSIVVVRINREGSILKAWHEQKSGHSLFDQSSLRAVREATPFPPLPKALGPGPLEIGIRFRPGEVGQ